MTDEFKSLVGGIKGEVLSTLASDSPLTAMNVFQKLQKQGSKATYQGVHKVMVQLASDQVVNKGEKGYEINKEWIKQLATFSDSLKNSVIDKQDGKLRDLKPPAWFSLATRSFSLFRNFFLNNRLRFGGEAIYLFDNRVNLVPSDAFISLARNGSVSERLSVYNACRQAGHNWCQTVMNKGFFASREDLAIHGSEALAVAGWGGYNIESFDPENHQATLSITSCSVAEEYVKQFGKSVKPVCDVPRGFFAGGFSIVLEEPALECVETQCSATGFPKCIFDLKPRKAFGKSNETLRQIGKKSEVRFKLVDSKNR